MPPRRPFKSSSDPAVVKERREHLNMVIQAVVRTAIKHQRVEEFLLLSVEEEMRESVHNLDADIRRVESDYRTEQGPRARFSTAIRANFEDLFDVEDDINAVGIGDSQMIIGVDYSLHNNAAGAQTFFERPLHQLAEDEEVPDPNPYQMALFSILKTMSQYDADNEVPMYGFQDDQVWLLEDAAVDVGGEYGWEEVFNRYAGATKEQELKGIANLAPMINKAVETVRLKPRSFHMLICLTTNDIDESHDLESDTARRTARAETTKAILAASEVPLSIIVVGIGDGPWTLMESFNHHLHWRNFDNVTFVNFHDTFTEAKFPAREFAKRCLTQVPEQVNTMRALGMLDPAAK